MSDDDLLDTEVTPDHQELASRLGLASIDSDQDRYRQALAEIVAAGMPTAVAVIGVLNNHLASGMANAIGVQQARALFERAIIDAGEAGE